MNADSIWYNCLNLVARVGMILYLLGSTVMPPVLPLLGINIVFENNLYYDYTDPTSVRNGDLYNLRGDGI